MKNFGLDECDGAPHEFRGVKRSTLLEALQKVVPSECVQYSASIHTVETDQNGTLPACNNMQSHGSCTTRCIQTLPALLPVLHPGTVSCPMWLKLASRSPQHLDSFCLMWSIHTSYQCQTYAKCSHLWPNACRPCKPDLGQPTPNSIIPLPSCDTQIDMPGCCHAFVSNFGAYITCMPLPQVQ